MGRPSTYASVIGTILERGYAQRQGQALVPTFTAFAVTALLEEHFPHLVDEKFTARMEETLDEISEGHAEWLPYLREFYLGDEGLRQQVQLHEKQIDPTAARTVDLGGLDAIVKIGKFGPYVEVMRDGESVKASIPKDAAPADLSSGAGGEHPAAEDRRPRRARASPRNRRADLRADRAVRAVPAARRSGGWRAQAEAGIAAQGRQARGRDAGAWRWAC